MLQRLDLLPCIGVPESQRGIRRARHQATAVLRPVEVDHRVLVSKEDVVVWTLAAHLGRLPTTRPSSLRTALL
eukprot:10768841-Prorocentrum_lima.AAC.1